MLDSDVEPSPNVLLEYEKLLKKSYTENFDDLYKTDLLKILGKDGFGYNIVLLIPCFVVTAGSDYYKTLRYIIMRLDPVVNENYVLILCETHTNWLMETVYMYVKQWYEVLPKKYKKNLKKLYLLHGGFLSKTILTILTPFISSNFWKKVEYIQKLEDLFIKLNIKPSYYLKYFPYIVQRNEEKILGNNPVSYFGADLEILCQRFGKNYKQYKHIPAIFIDFIEHLSKNQILHTKDLFNLQTDAITLYGIIGDIEYGEPSIDFDNIPALVCSFKLFLATLRNCLFGKDAFTRLIQIKNIATKKTLQNTVMILFEKLPKGNQEFIECLLYFFKEVTNNSKENNMTAEALSKIFAPTFFRNKKPPTNFQDCIPLANACLAMLIENPEILRKKQDDSNSDSESVDTSRLKSENEKTLTSDESSAELTTKKEETLSEDSNKNISKKKSITNIKKPLSSDDSDDSDTSDESENENENVKKTYETSTVKKTEENNTNEDKRESIRKILENNRATFDKDMNNQLNKSPNIKNIKYESTIKKLKSQTDSESETETETEESSEESSSEEEKNKNISNLKINKENNQSLIKPDYKSNLNTTVKKKSETDNSSEESEDSSEEDDKNKTNTKSNEKKEVSSDSSEEESSSEDS